MGRLGPHLWVSNFNLASWFWYLSCLRNGTSFSGRRPSFAALGLNWARHYDKAYIGTFVGSLKATKNGKRE
ncbi:hypothetical protein N0V93_006805 [Gnomoniopsis smithogilvyi]|uniref:Uncharacterized protein n=1 Tax=Gnomoniopsis smithogilvyi TaxID=1191159 RepID=A0A9W8YSE0_9PEZI|nr:hypothetical protein N0V93_006805 [Gnomoniopsis smithogilvyi]